MFSFFKSSISLHTDSTSGSLFAEVWTTLGVLDTLLGFCPLPAKLWFCLQVLHPPTERNRTNAQGILGIISLDSSLTGTRTWPVGVYSNTPWCVLVWTERSCEVDVWPSLSNTLHCPLHSWHNNFGQGICSTPSGRTECWSLSFIKYRSDAQGKSKGSLCSLAAVVTDS